MKQFFTKVVTCLFILQINTLTSFGQQAKENSAMLNSVIKFSGMDKYRPGQGFTLEKPVERPASNNSIIGVDKRTGETYSILQRLIFIPPQN